jgi:hypothetical protein
MNAVVKFPDLHQYDDETPVPDGEYSLAYTGHQIRYQYGTGKLFLRFKIVQGEYSGRRLYAAYRVKITGKRTFTCGQASNIYRQFTRLSGRRDRRDRLPVGLLKNVIVTASVRTVKTDWKQRPLLPHQFYSVVDELLAIEAGKLA